ncbi:hypothetical protein ACFLU6_00350 [Acidobacteriota bacterium]
MTRFKFSGILLLLTVILTACGETDTPLAPGESGRVDDGAIYFLQYSEALEPYNISATITFTMTGESFARGFVNTPSGERIALQASPSGILLLGTVTGTRESLKNRFQDGTYHFGAVFTNDFTVFIDRTLSGQFPSFPAIVAPVDDEEINLTPTIQWYRVPEADDYHVVVVELPCDCTVFEIEVGGDASFMSVAVPNGLLESGTPYRIEVRAVPPEGTKASASVIHVTTE